MTQILLELGKKSVHLPLCHAGQTIENLNTVIREMTHIHPSSKYEILDESNRPVPLEFILYNQNTEQRIFKFGVFNKFYQSPSDQSRTRARNLCDKVSTQKYSCIQTNCRKTFDDIDKLLQHSQIHADLKPVKCTFADCPKSFLDKGQLKNHNFIHQQIK